LTAPATKRGTPPPDRGGLFVSPARRNLLLALLIFAATIILYNPVNRHPFVNYDDDRYVTENPHVRSGLSWGTVGWAMTSTEQANWHPLTWISHALDCSLFHLNPAGHHFTSLLIHALNAVLLFVLLARATGRTGASFLAAGLFAFHPINVESVAWVAERKNVLSTFFFLATLGVYGWYVLKPDWRRYASVVVLFMCGLMSKPMVVTLPFALILLDYWPLGRMENSPHGAFEAPRKKFPSLLMEKAPLFLLSAGSSIITIRAQQSGGAIRSRLQFPLSVRLENAGFAYAMYLWKAIWPARLAPLYPHIPLAVWQVVAAVIVLIAVTVFGLRWKRYALVGWLWFLGTLVPVIGLVQVGDAAMADRYTYIPLIGIFVMVAFGLADLADALNLSPAARAIAVASVLLAFSIATERQLAYWSSSVDLWSHTLSVTGANYIAQDNLGGALVLLGKRDEAYPHFQAAAEINPRDPMSHSNLGAYLLEHARVDESIKQDNLAISLTSDRGLLASTYANLGSAYRGLGEYDKARQSYDEALRLNDRQFNAYLGLGILLEDQGRLADAISNYANSVELAPTAEGYIRLGHALEKDQRKPEALTAYRQALKTFPDLKAAQDAIQMLSDGR
jgi:tetratricopeptide (TPR) repeat protein